MALCVWRGDAQARANIWHATPALVDIGDTFTLTINRKDVIVTATAATVANVIGLFITAITAATDPEWQEVTATNGTTYLILTGPSDGKPVTITGTSTGGTNTVNEITTATGPNWFSNTENWSGGAVPVDADEIDFGSSTVGCYYGLAQGTTTPATIRRPAGGPPIGLPDWTGTYWEYRDKYLALGNAADAQIMTIILGEGEGSGGGRCKIDAADCQVTGIVHATGTSTDEYPAFLFKGTHASNAFTIYKGSVGIAVLSGEVATVLTLTMGYESSQDSDAEVICGKGVTLGTVVKNGGILTLGHETAVVASMTNYAGDATINGTSGVTVLIVRGGTVYYNTTGTLAGAPIVSELGSLDFSRDLRAKTVTNPIEVYGDEATVKDPNKSVTALVLDWNETTRLADIGRHIRITRGAVA
jgi:hypothetical protein